jgi:hypothetical protein
MKATRQVAAKPNCEAPPRAIGRAMMRDRSVDAMHAWTLMRGNQSTFMPKRDWCFGTE